MPPWFGGRTEVAHRGFAISLPHGWVAFDLAGDIGAQVKVARARLPDLTGGDAADLPMRLAQDLAAGVQVLALDFRAPSGPQHCSIGLPPEGEWQHDRDFAETAYRDMLSEAEPPEEVFPPRSARLPSGDAWVIDSANPAQPGQDHVLQYALYMLESHGGALIGCGGPVRPKDDWLSIVSTFEFLPPEE